MGAGGILVFVSRVQAFDGSREKLGKEEWHWDTWRLPWLPLKLSLMHCSFARGCSMRVAQAPQLLPASSMCIT